MSDSNISGLQLAFFKLNVENIDEALSFWNSAFGFEITGTFDEDSFIEHMLALPGQEEVGPHLMLVQIKPAREMPIGAGHGPVGLFCDDIAASYAKAQAAGGVSILKPTDIGGGILVAMLKSPQGHELELVQRPNTK